MASLGARTARILAGSLLTGCVFGGNPTPSGQTEPQHYEHKGLSFAYPSSWHAQRYEFVSTFFAALVYLSNQPMRPPCTTTTNDQETSISCGRPVRELQPGGIVAWWGAGGMPTWRFQDQSGSPMRVSGRAAKISISSPGTCQDIGASESITVIVQRPRIPDNYFAITACLKGPDIEVLEHQARAVIDSTVLPR